MKTIFMITENLRNLSKILDEGMVHRKIGTYEDPHISFLTGKDHEIAIRVGYLKKWSGNYYFQDPTYGVIQVIKQDNLPKP